MRLLLAHPQVQLEQVTSERHAGKFVYKVHPNLRKRTQLRFVQMADLGACDVLFLCLPHGQTMAKLSSFQALAPRLIDLSADFRLNDTAAYEQWYGKAHACPEVMREFVYGIPELHRVAMKDAHYISSAGCNATATILGLYPFFERGLVDLDHTVVELKVGSSEGGNTASEASHHPERSGAVRSFMIDRL